MQMGSRAFPPSWTGKASAQINAVKMVLLSRFDVLEVSFRLQDQKNSLLKKIRNLFSLGKRFWIIMCFHLSLQSSGFKAIQLAMFNGCPNPSSGG